MPGPSMRVPVAIAPIQTHVEGVIDDFMASLPRPDRLSAKERRGIIARYASVLEGNFIYWMTGAFIAVRSDAARSKILENLHEEVRDSHPLMMRKFAIAAGALPSAADTLAVHQSVTEMRLFIGRLSPVRIVVAMAFFEGLIQRFMPYLAELARLQGSTEMQYTDVHGVCDVTHTAELYRALEAEMTLADEPVSEKNGFFEGVELLNTLIENIIVGSAVQAGQKGEGAYRGRAQAARMPANQASTTLA
jgi:Iron-containing redox enzyme